MKQTKILIYDDQCHLCNWYTGMFVKYGFLPEDGRRPFSTLESSLLNSIDLSKGRNEIPLLDLSSGKVIYGIDSMLELLGQKYPLIKRTGHTQPINWLLRKIYKLISYNRKVILAKKCGPGVFDCSPDFNDRYRLLFMGIFLFFNTIMLYPLHANVFSKLSYFNLTANELSLAHFALVLSNCTLAVCLSWRKAIDYLGQVNMLALTSILLLTPLLAIQFIGVSEWVITGYLVATAVFIFREYLRRMDYAGVLLKYKWVVSVNLLCLTGFLIILFH